MENLSAGNMLEESKVGIKAVDEKTCNALTLFLTTKFTRNKVPKIVTKRKVVRSCAPESLAESCERLKKYFGEIEYTVGYKKPCTMVSSYYEVLVTGPKEKVKEFLKSVGSTC